MRLLIFIALWITCVFGIAPLLRPSGDVIEDRYIVVFKEEASQKEIDLHFLSISSSEIEFRYAAALRGYAGPLSTQTLIQALNSSIVDYVEHDQMMYASDEECGIQSDAEWNLDRISTQGKYKQTNIDFSYEESGGEGIVAYVIDTGIYIKHNDFGGRASYGKSFVSSEPTAEDFNGHGTHVAGTIIGDKYGIAKKATAVAVKVLGKDGSGTNSGVIAGIDWVAEQSGKRVVNLSLGGGASTSTDTAINNLYKSGAAVAVAAGNDNQNACSYSPARAANAFTVGATAEPASGYSDPRSSFSNYGTCVKIFAPGSSILSAWIGGPTRTNTISGTSMASPHVAGAFTALWARYPTFDASELYSAVAEFGSKGVVNFNCGSNTVCNSSPNVFLYSAC